MDGDGRLSWLCRSSPMVFCGRTCAQPLVAAFIGRPGFMFLALLGLDLESDWLQIYTGLCKNACIWSKLHLFLLPCALQLSKGGEQKPVWKKREKGCGTFLSSVEVSGTQVRRPLTRTLTQRQIGLRKV
ncbi:hypothetical protein OPV22_025001 [Ensete ventricosum]|uniref:Uncharacterized protein n=1 Tax=Ensete ventricosum TaxID=4639 RepID=A0AAV8QCM1_ENSVE|nr:hypothetical protein OPV22_025001 [Ensete ventricosum]